MTRKTIDRRVARSRAALQRALNELSLKKSYEAITIKEICEAADVARATFYAHYAGKDDLKRSGFEPLRRELAHRQKAALARPGHASDRGLGFSLGMFEHARDHIDQYRALVGGRGGAVALGAIRKMLSDLARGALAESGGRAAADAVPRELVVQFVVGAFMAVMTWWLDGGAKLPPERIDAIFRRLAAEGIGIAAS